MNEHRIPYKLVIRVDELLRPRVKQRIPMTEKLRRILIVDDDSDIVANLSDILSDVGYETVTALSGENALEKFEDDIGVYPCQFDLCLVDFKMPGMDGVELLKRIHAKQPRVPAIMITAYAGEDGGQRALDAGTISVLQKPVDVRALLGLITQTLD